MTKNSGVPRDESKATSELTLTFDGVTRAAKDAGFGETLPDDYSDSAPVFIAGGVMPLWMAEIYGHIGRKREGEKR